ncbi:hypothetical protein F0U44_16105 [Nocardioides humilatus]|uniref:Nitroreductase domain-containing protein n=1 Tax=Nocardioides humilatus TaxID=2607660 RepID=A0A5B1LDX3_9ACTN|nr:nitroreductase family protein [Nocardioides humilatus]KAA1417807.1 hypothetical protein F0U44_16105 [Nocardioides humilatus]
MIGQPVLERLVELACLAPSVHNTQPWMWHTGRGRVRLYADRTRLLPDDDLRGRNLVMSCGAALDHFRYAARALSLDTEVTRLPEGPRSDLLAEISLLRSEPSPSAAEDIAALRARCTDRRRFTSWPVPAAALEGLAEEARARGAVALPVTDVGTRIRLELLTKQGHLVSAVPAFPRPDIPTVAETRAVVESSDGAIVIGAEVDEPAAWLQSGEALSSMWLRATREGLSVVPLSLPADVDAVRTTLRHDETHGAVVPHVLVRIGWQAIGRSQLPRTPRRPLAEVLAR